MARMNNISKQTLRFYDKIKLLTPDTVDETNGYRYYSISQSAYLDMIQYMKSLGIKLNDIKRQLELKDPSLIKTILRKKSDQINTEIRGLKQQKRAIERTLQSYQHYETSPPDGTIILEYIPARSIYYINAGINFYDYSIDVYEKMLRKLKENLISDKLPQIYFCNAGTILRQKSLKQHEFYSSEIFVLVDREFVADQLTVSIPANTYLCIYCNEFDKEKEYITRLLDTIDKEGYRIIGDYICEVIAEFPLLERKKRGMFLRLQIPIKFS
jgi:DNA-binding transcriptional MerR regulator